MILLDVDAEAWSVVRAAAMKEIDRSVARSERKLAAASEARRRIPVGSSRASVTAANARYMRAAEAHDRNIRAREAILAARAQQ